MRNIISKIIKRIGFIFPEDPPVEFDQRDVEIFDYVFNSKTTMVSPQRLFATIQACKFVLENQIDGDFVECGVWRGGNSIAAKLIFEAHGSDKRVLLFDTFAGMTEPEEHDRSSSDGKTANAEYIASIDADHNKWCYASLEDVKQNFVNAGVSTKNVEFIKGDVAETLRDKKNLPESISVLRLDTDWYLSTKIEMEVLYPLLSSSGPIIIDDYGHWDGARKAIEEYFQINKDLRKPLLQYTDYTGRMGIKP